MELEELKQSIRHLRNKLKKILSDNKDCLSDNINDHIFSTIDDFDELLLAIKEEIDDEKIAEE